MWRCHSCSWKLIPAPGEGVDQESLLCRQLKPWSFLPLAAGPAEATRHPKLSIVSAK